MRYVVISFLTLISVITPEQSFGASRETVPRADESKIVPDRFIDSMIQHLNSRIKEPVALQRLENQWGQLNTAWTNLCQAVHIASRKLRQESPAPEKPTLNPFAPLAPQLATWPEIRHAYLPSGRQYHPIPHSFLTQSIPLPYRLAELFGIGTNQLHIVPNYQSAHILNDDFNGHSIGSQLAIEFFGTFTARKPLTQVESFRLRVSSADLVNSAIIRLSPHVKPHHREVREIPTEKALLENRNVGHRWFRDLMNSIPRDSQPVLLPGPKAEHEREFRKAIGEENEIYLETLRAQFIETVRDMIQNSEALSIFRSHTNNLASQGYHALTKEYEIPRLNVSHIPFEDILSSEGGVPRLPLTSDILRLLAAAQLVHEDSRREMEMLMRTISLLYPFLFKP